MFHKTNFTADARPGHVQPPSGPAPATPISANLLDNLVYLRTQFGISSDLMIREIHLCGYQAAVITMEGMVNRHILADAILLPITEIKGSKRTPAELMEYIRDDVLGSGDMIQVRTMEELMNLIASGFAAIAIDGVDYMILGGIQGFAMRGVSEPASEVMIRGSREGFTEVIRINLSMLRRRLKTPDLIFEMMKAGKTSNTDVCLCYMRGRVSEKLLRNVRQRIENLPLDVVLDSGYIQPFLENKHLSIFTSVNTTERPDTLCGKISEGRIGILVDGTPFALIVPYLFVENFQAMDDYTMPPYYASFLRILKYIAFVVSLLLPGLYVAIGTHHPEMFPPVLLLSYLNADHTTPFPLTFEALLIHFLFEIMREAGLRFPRAGHAVSIVGALVIGQAAVEAGLVGAPMVIILALTAISSFILPTLYAPISILRFVFILLGGALGLYGILLGATLLLCSICAIDVMGIPYTAPVSPLTFKALKDVVIRADWRQLWKNKFRVQNVKGSDLRDDGKQP